MGRPGLLHWSTHWRLESPSSRRRRKQEPRIKEVDQMTFPHYGINDTYCSDRFPVFQFITAPQSTRQRGVTAGRTLAWPARKRGIILESQRVVQEDPPRWTCLVD